MLNPELLSQSRIAVSTRENILILDLENREITRLPWQSSDVAWSPSGDWIAFTAPVNETGLDGLWAYNFHNQSIALVVSHKDSNISNPCWSSNSYAIAYDCWLVEAQLNQARCAKVEDGEVTFLSRPGMTNPRWISLETADLLLQGSEEGGYVVDSGDNYRRDDFLSRISNESNHFEFSRDYTRIAGVTFDCSNMFIVNADQTDYRLMSLGEGFHHSLPTWAPDGVTVALRVQQDGCIHQLWVLDITSGSSGLVLEGEEDWDGRILDSVGVGKILGLSWSPWI